MNTDLKSVFIRAIRGLFLLMSAELKSHGGQNFISEISLASRTEALEQRRAQHGHWNAFFDRCINGPASFTGVGDTSREAFQLWMLRESNRRQVQQPRRDDTTAPPEFRDLGYVEIVLVMLGI